MPDVCQKFCFEFFNLFCFELCFMQCRYISELKNIKIFIVRVYVTIGINDENFTCIFRCDTNTVPVTFVFFYVIKPTFVGLCKYLFAFIQKDISNALFFSFKITNVMVRHGCQKSFICPYPSFTL